MPGGRPVGLSSGLRTRSNSFHLDQLSQPPSRWVTVVSRKGDMGLFIYTRKSHQIQGNAGVSGRPLPRL